MPFNTLEYIFVEITVFQCQSYTFEETEEVQRLNNEEHKNLIYEKLTSYICITTQYANTMAVIWTDIWARWRWCGLCAAYDEDREVISQSCQTKDNWMGSWIVLCDVLHEWIAQRQVGLLSACCDRVCVMSCVCMLWQGGCHVLCLYTVTGWGVMPCVCMLWQGGCHVLCLYTVTGWGVMPCVCILRLCGVSCPVSVYCDRVGCHVLCLYTVTGWGVMPCVCMLWQGGCHVLCLYTVTGWGVMPCVCMLWQGGCHVLCLYTVTGWGVMPCVCILWRGGVSCLVSVYCDGVRCHVLCLYTVTGWGVMSCVCIMWLGGVSCPVSVYCDRVC